MVRVHVRCCVFVSFGGYPVRSFLKVCVQSGRKKENVDDDHSFNSNNETATATTTAKSGVHGLTKLPKNGGCLTKYLQMVPKGSLSCLLCLQHHCLLVEPW